MLDFNIVVTEYPKCGGTWLTTLIGDALHIPKRDLYINDERIKNSADTYYKGIHNHHWYKNFNSFNILMPCVIKSHEFPNSALINFNAKYIHLIRDGRDVIVSKYFFEKDFCIANGLTKNFDISFNDFLIKTAHEWKAYINAWLNLKTPFIKYEDLLLDTKKTLVNLFTTLNIDHPNETLDFVIADNVKDKFSIKLETVFRYNTFVRKGISGDWKNYFTEEHTNIFFDITGDMLNKLGYEK